MDAENIALGDPLRQDVFKLFSFVVAGDLTEEVLPLVYDAVLDMLDQPTRLEALEIASDITGKLVVDIDESVRLGILQTIENGLEAQTNLDDIVDEIRENVGLTAQQVRQQAAFAEKMVAEGVLDRADIDNLLALNRQEMIQRRSETIARTEIRTAVEGGERLVMEGRGATHKVSISVGDTIVSDICRKAEAEGAIEIGEDFASGKPHPPHHPNCRCTTSYITETGEGESERADKRAGRRSDRTDEAFRLEEEIQQELPL